MKITYTAPNRSHHYPYAKAMYEAGVLHAFISGFSRFSPRSELNVIGDLLKRHDLYQNLYIASLKLRLPIRYIDLFNKLSHNNLDRNSFKWAKNSDAFIFYRTEGYETTLKLKKEHIPTICIMEEVNSHADTCLELMKQEHKEAGLGSFKEKFADHTLRLKTYETSDYILCPSEFVRKSFIKKGFSTEKLIKVNFGFTNLAGIEKNQQNINVFRVLYVGQIHYRKGLRYAIEAFKKIIHPNKEFVIVGPVTAETGLENTQIPANVIFTGALKGEELLNQYRRASVFVLPSVEEGLALVQGEALSFGIPIIVTTNTGADDLIKDGNEGFIVPVFEYKTLADRLQLLADDVILLEKMSHMAYETAQRLGNWNTAVDKLINEICKRQN